MARASTASCFLAPARGDFRQDPDYDMAVFLRTLPGFWTEAHKLAAFRVDFLDLNGAFFNAFPFASSAYEERTPIMHEVRLNGVDV